MGAKSTAARLLVVVRYLSALVLYVIFAIAAKFAGSVGILVGLARFDARYTANVMHAMDCLLAALFGWNGRATVSKECGREILAGRPCRFCRILCRILNVALREPRHCEREAE